MDCISTKEFFCFQNNVLKRIDVHGFHIFRKMKSDDTLGNEVLSTEVSSMTL